jgi:hypothetical protein
LDTRPELFSKESFNHAWRRMNLEVKSEKV